MKKSQQKKARAGRPNWLEVLTTYQQQGLLSAKALWSSDPVAAYLLWQQALSEGVSPEQSLGNDEQIETFVKELAELSALRLYQIDANDDRLSVKQKQDVRRAIKKQKGVIPEERARELVEYVSAFEPVDHADLQKTIIDERKAAGLPPLSDEELNREVGKLNEGDGSMWKCVAPDYPQTPGERLVWSKNHAAKAPITQDEWRFGENLRLRQERKRRNELSLELRDQVGVVKKGLREHESEKQILPTMPQGAPCVEIRESAREGKTLYVNGSPRLVHPDALEVIAEVVRGLHDFQNKPRPDNEIPRRRRFKIVKNLNGNERVGCNLHEIIKHAVPERVGANSQIASNPSNLFRDSVKYPETKQTYKDLFELPGKTLFWPILFTPKA